MTIDFEQGPDERSELERRINDLNRMAGTTARSLEGRLDTADAAYSLAHDAGLMRREEDGSEEPFVWPSVRRERLYQELLRQTPRPRTVASAYVEDVNWLLARDPEYLKEHQRIGRHYREMCNPQIALDGCDDPVAILETVQDNDGLGGSSKLTWFGCGSYQEAAEYCDTVGWNHEKPGPGEDDGVYTYRRVYDNPYFLDTQNRSLGEVDDTAIMWEIDRLFLLTGLKPEETVLEQDILKSLVYGIETWNRTVRNGMLGSEDVNAVRAYLNSEVRGQNIKRAHAAQRAELTKTVQEIDDTMSGFKPESLSEQEIEIVVGVAKKISEALQTPYELASVTQESVLDLARVMIQIGRMKALGVKVFADNKLQAEGKSWIKEVDRLLEFMTRGASMAYGKSMQRFLDDKHYFA
jgi:hypothetical protein